MHRGGGRGLALAIVAGEHDPGTALVGDDAVVMDLVVAAAVDQHADAEVPDFQPGQFHAAGIAQDQPRQRSGTHVGAGLAGFGPRAGIGAGTGDVGRAVDGDVLAIACPRRADDLHRPDDLRQRRGRTDHVGGVAHRGNLDPVAPRRLVGGTDRPAQRTRVGIIGIALHPQHLQ